VTALFSVDLETSAHSKDDLASITLITAEEPLQYRALLTDGHVLVFLSSVMLFHFANASMLPLLSQQLFINNSDKGLIIFLHAATLVCDKLMAAFITTQVAWRAGWCLRLERSLCLS
jgi:hypothetical protein